MPPDLPRATPGMSRYRLVHDEHGIPVGQGLERVLARHVAQAVRLPATPAEDRLLPPRPGVARRLGPHPARLAPLRTKQPVDKQARRACHPFLGEQRPHPRLGLAQRRGPQLQRRLEGCTARRARSQSPSADKATYTTATVMLMTFTEVA